MDIPLTPLRKYTAMGLAGTPDLEAGALIASLTSVAFYLLSLRDTPQTTLFALCFGAICALSPDIWDFFWFRKAAHGNDEGDHHDRKSHSPIIGVVGWSLFGYIVGGQYYMTIGILCILWHFVHDSWLGDGYFNWLNPIGTHQRHAASPKLLDWLQLWLQPSPRSLYEMVLGALALALALSISGYPFLGCALALGHIVFNHLFWLHLRSVEHVRA